MLGSTKASGLELPEPSTTHPVKARYDNSRNKSIESGRLVGDNRGRPMT